MTSFVVEETIPIRYLLSVDPRPIIFLTCAYCHTLQEWKGECPHCGSNEIKEN